MGHAGRVDFVDDCSTLGLNFYADAVGPCIIIE